MNDTPHTNNAGTIDTGGPAFPRAAQYENGMINDFGQEGMTLLDYHAAHAPREIPAWFEPEMPPRPTIPHDDRLNEIWKAADGEEEFLDGKQYGPEVWEYFERKNDALIARNEWDKAKARAELVQWPYAWARLQIEERRRLGL